MVSHFTTYFAVTWSTDVHGHTVRGAMDAGPRNKLLRHANLRSQWDEARAALSDKLKG